VQVIVELRNYTGVMVIDRNDELCVMYERKSVQETVQTQGDYALAKLEDQIRVLKIDVADVSRSIEATKKKCPEIPKLDENIATLQRDIMITQQEGRELELQLEDPSNTKRWRMLHGRIKDKDELRIKVNQLEERLNHKKEQLLERDLILEEVWLSVPLVMLSFCHHDASAIVEMGQPGHVVSEALTGLQLKRLYVSLLQLGFNHGLKWSLYHIMKKPQAHLQHVHDSENVMESVCILHVGLDTSVHHLSLRHACVDPRFRASCRSRICRMLCACKQWLGGQAPWQLQRSQTRTSASSAPPLAR
jgi:hypothetical protein